MLNVVRRQRNANMRDDMDLLRFRIFTLAQIRQSPGHETHP